MATLKDLREHALLSQSDLAKACGVGKHSVWQWENAHSTPSAENIRKLVEVLKCTPEELLSAIRATRLEKDRKDF
jgi:transcriptional regulator with XRE-family HTH domain